MPSLCRSLWCLPLLAACIAAMLAGSAQAQSSASDEAQPAALSWVRGTAARDCASAHELAALVEEQLGRPVFVAPTQAGIAIEGFIDVDAAANEYLVRFGLIEHGHAVQAERVLMLPHVTCRELDPLLSFVLAAMLDPDAPLLPPRLPEGLSENTRSLLADLFGNEPTVPPLELAAPSGKRASTTEPAVSAQHPEPAVPVVARKPRRQARMLPRLTLFVSGGAGAGLLPAVTPAGTFEARYRFFQDWVARASWSLWLERSVAPNSTSVAGFSLWSGSLLACPAPLWDSAFPLRACAGAAFGRVATTVRGVQAPEDPARLYAAGVLALDASWSPGAGIWLRAGASGLLSLVRDRFVLEDSSGRITVHEPSWLGAQLELGVGVALY